MYGEPLSPSPFHAFFITRSLFLYYLASPSPLNFHVVRADMAFLCLAHKALWCSVYWSWSIAVFVCQCVCVFVCVPCAHACIHVNIGDAMLTHSPVSSHFSHTQITLYVIPEYRRLERNGEREILQKVHLVSLAAPKLQHSWDSLHRKDHLKLFWAEIQISFCFGPKQQTKLPCWDQ